MVNPPGQSLGGANNGLQLQALSSDSLRYLGQQVGKIIEARVIQVITLHTGDVSSKPGGSAGSATLPNPNNTSTTRGPLQPNPAERYELRLSIDNKHTLKVASPLAPRIGQLLQLAVIDNQQLRIVGSGAAGDTRLGNALTGSANAPASAAATVGANPVTHSAAATSQPTPASKPAATATLSAAPQTATAANTIPTPALATSSTAGSAKANHEAPLILALRDALPRQLERASLAPALATLAARQGTAPAASDQGASRLAVNNTAKPSTAQSVGAPATTSTTPAAQPPGGAAISPAASASAAGLPITALQQASSQLAAAIADGKALSNPVNVRNALLNSGLFYEQKLVQAATQLRARQTVASAATESPRSTTSIAEPLRLDAHSRNEVQQSLRGDLKYQLLHLAQTLRSTVAASQPSLLTAPSPSATASAAREGTASERSGESLLANLWQALGSSANTTEPGDSRAQLDPLLQLLRLALGGSARTQAHQLMALGSQFASQADPQLAQSLTVELPLWLEQRLALVDVRIEREKTARESRQALAAWNVRLHFDMDELGELTALATLQGKRVAAVLWASADTLAQKIQLELNQVGEQLAEQGLNVQHLQCRTGAAPEAAAHSAINVMQLNLLDTQG
ncbi:MAG: flagellar hook-length control protein FliK [Gammaproteobacteria bacterium]|nr:flagellar hook-length control protein FliK [Gammaproteobacteria bacterium]